MLPDTRREPDCRSVGRYHARSRDKRAPPPLQRSCRRPPIFAALGLIAGQVPFQARQNFCVHAAPIYPRRFQYFRAQAFRPTQLGDKGIHRPIPLYSCMVPLDARCNYRLSTRNRSFSRKRGIGMSDLRPGQGAESFNVRLPAGMRDRIKVGADLNARSMNAEIVATLEERYPATSVDVRAVDSLLHYIANATTPGQVLERIAEVNAKFEAVGSPLRIEQGREGKLTIVTEF